MPQPNSPRITSTPAERGQPYDPHEDGTPPWRKLESNAGPASLITGRVEGDFPDDAPWRQV